LKTIEQLYDVKGGVTKNYKDWEGTWMMKDQVLSLQNNYTGCKKKIIELQHSSLEKICKFI
jgi:hypothetical protein